MPRVEYPEGHRPRLIVDYEIHVPKEKCFGIYRKGISSDRIPIKNG